MSEPSSPDSAPFGRLDPATAARLEAAADLVFFAAGETILEPGAAAEGLYGVASGQVQQRHGAEIWGRYGPGQYFDLKALFGPDGRSIHASHFVARDDTMCYLVPAPLVIEQAVASPECTAIFRDDMIAELQALAARRTHRNLAALMTAAIRQAFLHPALYVAPDLSIREAARHMKQAATTSLLVRDGERVGIISDRDLQDAVILDGQSALQPIAPLVHFDLITLSIDDYLFNALNTMTAHSIRRVVICDGNVIAGILEQVDILHVMARQADVVTLQIDGAATVEDLRPASDTVVGVIEALQASGTRIQTIAALVTQLNRRILARLFQLLAPAELLANSCFIVMGSEGRSEQILKTDQDNGLILRDGFTLEGLPTVTRAITDALLRFGYPECQGGVMVCTPEWTRSQSGFRGVIHDWVHRLDEAAQLNLAIFYDAAAVAGDATLLDQVKGYFLDLLSDNSAFFSHFARPAIQFDTPIGLFSALRGEQFDIKKGGIFPLVHGVRSLTLERRLPPTGTLARLQALESAGALDRSFAGELAEAFCTMQALRLKLRVEAGQAGSLTDNMIRVDELNRMERDLLRQSFVIVKKFKEFLTYHFHLKMF
ncbi:MAG: putative nucleotidyltransferase substrate binding domain-containing protein [Azospirillaceae bacterium]|nr:putative nucleotidyltransferase substrate binding domain-containing protein [Azospirillaceae bacterium]